jgi:hypothetical protein
MAWRFDSRNNPYLLRDTMIKLIEATNPPSYLPRLVSAENLPSLLLVIVGLGSILYAASSFSEEESILPGVIATQAADYPTVTSASASITLASHFPTPRRCHLNPEISERH